VRALAWLTVCLAACGSNGDTPGHGDPDSRRGDNFAGDATGGDATTGDSEPDCGIAGIAGACLNVGDCTGASFALCDGPPSNQCCLTAEVACSVSGAPGVCIDTAACPAGWQSTAGLCPGAANIQCCTEIGVACDPAATPHPNESLVEESWDVSCADGMVTVTSFCIDKFEASLVLLDGGGDTVSSWSPFVNPGVERVRALSLRGAIPQGYINGDQAEAACLEAGKRLCSSSEWLRACQGATVTTYPYGDVREPGRCNDARARHPAIEYFGTSDSWIWSELDNGCINQIPDALHITGQQPSCTSEDGALDMMGNLHEWNADASGTFRGGFYADTVINGDGCLYATTAHNRQHWDYSTGFRCCADR